MYLFTMMQEVFECKVCITLENPAASGVLTSLSVRFLSLGTPPYNENK